MSEVKTPMRAKISKSNVTLENVIRSEDRNFRKLISLLAKLGLVISRQIPQHLGMAQTSNVYGERQEKLDVWANNLLATKLLKSGLVRQVASEELKQVLSAKIGEFTVAFDPIDGSSNLESNNALGTIVGIYQDESLPAKGRDLLCSMYFMYGPYLELVLALKDEVRLFVANGKGEAPERYVSDGEVLQLPKEAEVYGVGGMRNKWTPRVRDFVELLENRGLKLRYSGSFTGDVNQVLIKGGFFAYPELIDAPDGKFRLQFESNPVSFIIEKAGGRATAGMQRILDVEPNGIAQRVPTYLGNAELIAEFEDSVRSKT